MLDHENEGDEWSRMHPRTDTRASGGYVRWDWYFGHTFETSQEKLWGRGMRDQRLTLKLVTLREFRHVMR